MKLRTVLATATTAAILATSGVAIAGAASGHDSKTATTATSATTNPDRPNAGARVKVRLRLRKLLKGAGEVVTNTIGIDRTTLRAELRSGNTLAEIATAHGSTPQAVIDALVTAANKKIDAAATAGMISPERAARIESRLPTRITRLVNEWHPKHLR
jgi:ribosomal protein S20